MARRVPKILVHPDGEIFCTWHPTQNIYCPVICDEDVPPAVAKIKHDPMIDMSTMRWVPVFIQTVETRHIIENKTGPYDPETGESLDS